MDSTTFSGDLKGNQILLNPRLPETTRNQIEQFIQEEAAFDHHFWFASSGSTAKTASEMKLVALSLEAMLASAEAVNVHLASDSSDRWLQPLPPFHVGGAGIWARAWLSKAFVMDAYSLLNGKWQVELFYQLLLKERITLTSLVPTQVYDLVQAQLKAPSSLRAIVVGGGAIAKSLYKQARLLGWPILPSYGLTECSSQVATASLSSLKDGVEMPSLSILSHIHIQTDSDQCALIKSPSLLTAYAYWNELGEHSIIDPKQEQAFLTDDRLFYDERGIYSIERVGDWIKIGGESVNLHRLELLWQSYVSQLQLPLSSHLIDLADDRLGRIIALAVEQESSLLWEQAIKCYQTSVLPFERIRKTYYQTPLPRSPLGKVLKGELRQRIDALNPYTRPHGLA